LLVGYSFLGIEYFVFDGLGTFLELGNEKELCGGRAAIKSSEWGGFCSPPTVPLPLMAGSTTERDRSLFSIVSMSGVVFVSTVLFENSGLANGISIERIAHSSNLHFRIDFINCICCCTINLFLMILLGFREFFD
jgi:hypothetical protein